MNPSKLALAGVSPMASSLLPRNLALALVAPALMTLAGCSESDGPTATQNLANPGGGGSTAGASAATTGDSTIAANGGAGGGNTGTTTGATTASNGSGGTSGVPGTSGGASSANAGMSNMADAGGAASMSMGGSAGDAAGDVIANDGDSFVSDVTISVHDEVNTILVVTWSQTMAADEVWLEFSFEGSEVMTSRPSPGAMGEQRDVVLGVPGDTEVTLRVVSSQAGTSHVSSDYTATTDSIPGGMPVPEVLSYAPDLASPNRWLFGAVEDSDGGCTSPACYYHTTFWLYIMDRQGRIVWYYSDPASNATSSFQRRARDGEYIWIEKRPFGGAGSRGVLKMTLDWEYFEEVDVPGLSDCIDVTDDGSLLYDVNQSFDLREMTRDGNVRTIWNCPDHFGNGFQCYSNTVNWNPLDDTILLSFPEERTAIEIDRQTGNVVGQYGDAPGSYAFSPPSWEFEYNHFSNITPEGTLLISSHMPGFEDTRAPVAGEHAFMEFEIDRANETLIEKWIYNEGPEWAMFKGMAIRLPGGNTLANYGTGGVIREITPDKQTAFHVKFDAEMGDDFFNKMVGHNELIDDLYALNGGPQ